MTRPLKNTIVFNSPLNNSRLESLSTNERKRILIIAGPNGAGKTTFAQAFLPNEANCPTFVNADLIAAGLSPFQPEKVAFRASRLMLEEMNAHVRRGESFAFETTLSGKVYALRIPEWRRLGYRVSLIFLRLTSVELALERIRQRVREGGHDVPEVVVRRRFEAGLSNYHHLYRPLVDEWYLYDNSGEIPTLIETGCHD